MMKNIVPLILSLVLLFMGLTACNAAPEELLPQSMKGYELYSWQEGGTWHFTLITGTNRNKIYGEIITESNFEADDGWVQIQVEGTGELKELLKRLPEGESVFWSDGYFIDEPESTEIHLGYPSQDIIDEITAHAEKHGLELVIPL